MRNKKRIILVVSESVELANKESLRVLNEESASETMKESCSSRRSSSSGDSSVLSSICSGDIFRTGSGAVSIIVFFSTFEEAGSVFTSVFHPGHRNVGTKYRVCGDPVLEPTVSFFGSLCK